MNRESIKSDLRELIRPYISDEVASSDLDESADLINDLKINSAHIVDIVLDIEDKYDIIVEDEVIGKMSTVESVIDTIASKVGA